jgi:hypothetical protein
MTLRSGGTPAKKITFVRFRFFNTPIDVETDVPEWAVLYSQLCGRAAASRPAGVSGPRLVIRTDTEPPRPGAAWERLPLDGSRGPALWYNPKTGTGMCRVPAPRDMRASRNTAVQALSLYCRLQVKPRGLYFCHASGVRSRGGGMLFAGENEAGKSTLMRQFALNGFPFLADDTVALEMRDGRAVAHVARQAVHLGAPTKAGRFQRLGFAPAPVAGFYYPPAARGPWPVTVVVFTRIGKRAAIEEVSEGDRLPRLVAMNETPLFRGDFPRAFVLYEALAQRARCLSVIQKKGEAFPVERLLEAL